jgi:peptide/nickel transport system permease protein
LALADFGATVKRRVADLARLSEALYARHRMLWVIARRLVLALPILVITPLVTFVLGRLALTYTQQGAGGFGQTVEAQPPPFGSWLAHALQGDLGTSLVTSVSVTRILGYRAPITVALVVGTLLVSALVGGALGVVSAVRGGVLGRVLDALAVVGFAFPVFWLGPVLVEWFAVDVRWFPAIFPFDPSPSTPGAWVHACALPVVTLSFGGIAAVATQAREAMLETLASEHIRMARARGLAPVSVVLRHALRTAAPKVLNVLGVLAAGLLAGAIFVENVYALPGLGTQLLQSLQQHDLPLVEAIVLFFTLLIVAISLVIDLIHAWLDPRVKVQ